MSPDQPPKPTIPFALIAKQASAIRLTAVDERAEAMGLQPRLTLAAARARVPELEAVEADPAADARLLANLAEACRRYTPALALDPPDALDLDITGAGHLFGGEAALIAAVEARFAAAGFSIRCAVASNPAAAYAFARYPAPTAGTEVERLTQMPIIALRLEPDAAEVLNKLGLRRIGQLLALPRADLALRLGPGVLDRLDMACGRRVEALPLVAEVPPFLVEARLFEPVCTELQVMDICLRLAARLCSHLLDKGVGGRRFGLELFRVDGAIKRIEVQSSIALADPARIAGLFGERLAALNEGLEADFGFDQARLWALNTHRLKPGTADLLRQGDGEGDFLAFLDRVRARFGAGVVKRFAPALESRLPEAAVRRASADRAGSESWREDELRYDGVPLRPLTLFAPPQPISAIAGVPEDPPVHFVWRKVSRQVVCAEGPERIAAEWWRTEEPDEAKEQGADCVVSPASCLPIRDYYRLEDVQGRRYWVFREGLYAADAPPRWFLHGLFA